MNFYRKAKTLLNFILQLMIMFIYTNEMVYRIPFEYFTETQMSKFRSHISIGET